MIDLETMGVRPTSAIVSIGAVEFTATEILKVFHTPINLESCFEAGLTADQSTIDWWAKQSDEARSSWESPDAPPLEIALATFSQWIRDLGSGDICPWGNGADFDLVLLTNAYRAFDAEPPWKFYNQHCFRTLKNLFYVGNVARYGVHHNAADDAIHQVNHLHQILALHNLKLPE